MARVSDERVMEKLGEGRRTHHVAKRLGWVQGTNLARRYLLRLEKAGKVKRHPQYTATNDIYWVPALSLYGAFSGGWPLLPCS